MQKPTNLVALALFFMLVLAAPVGASASEGEDWTRVAVKLDFLEPAGASPAVEFTVNNGQAITVGDQVPIKVTLVSEPASAITYYVDGVVKHASTAAVYTWDTSGTTPGKHFIKVKVKDKSGLTKLATQPVTVNTRFTVNKEKPFKVGDKVPITVTAVPGEVISKITYYVDGVVKHASAATSYIWDTGGTSPGDHTIKVKLTDKNGRTKTAAQKVTVNPPSKITVDFTVNHGQTIKAGDKVPITAAITSKAGIKKIEYYVDDIIKKATTASNYVWDTSGTSTGNHYIKVKVTDNNGQMKASVHLVSVKER
jgi:chitinase